MHPPKFDYYRAGSVEEAVSLLQEYSGAKLLAGGHSLIPAMNLRLADPGTLIDIGRIDGLRGIDMANHGGVAIGPLTTHAEIAADVFVPRVLSEAAGMVGDPQVRNRGTIGGNVAHADPGSDLPTALLALEAVFTLTGPGGTREVEAKDFFVDLFTTAVGADEVLTAITLWPEPVGTGSAYEKLPQPASRYSMVSAAAICRIHELTGNFATASVVVGGLTPTPHRAPSVVAALVGQPANEETIAAAAEAVQQDLGDDILGDIHASAEYRKAMATVLVRRALAKAMQRSGEAMERLE